MSIQGNVSKPLPLKKCAVVTCTSPGQIVYSFPNPAKQWKNFLDWLYLCENQELKTTRPETLIQSHGICDLHFEKKKGVIGNMMPTLLLPSSVDVPVKPKEEIYEANQLCRLCFNVGSVDLFSCKYYKKILKDIVKTFLPIEIRRSDISTVVCESCKIEVIRFYNFMLKSLQVDEYFQAINKETEGRSDESEIIVVEPSISLIELNNDQKLLERVNNKAANVEVITIDDNDDDHSNLLSILEDEDEKLEIKEETIVGEDLNHVPQYFIEVLHNYVKNPDKPRKIKERKSTLLEENSPDANDDATIICIHCNDVIANIHEFHAHCIAENHAPIFTCSECNRMFKDQSDLDIHSEIHKKHESSMCDRCGKQFNKKESLAMHLNTVHKKGDFKYVCTQCPKKFLTNYRLKLHMRIHNNERPYCCEQCGAVFTLLANLKNHQSIHSDYKPHVCLICSKAFRRKYKLAIHLTKHTGERKYSCERCGVSYKRKVNLTRHNRKHHINPDEEIEETPRNCTQCDYTCKFSTQLKVHMMKVHRSYTCIVCNMVFKSYQPYYNHKFKHFPYKKKFVCIYCNKRFINATLLNVHMVIHTGKKNFQCHVCSKRFSQKPHLQSHLLTHTGERPHKCQYCVKSFAHLSTLVVHERTHTGETPYVCEYCNKGFGHLTNYKKHVFSQHGVIMPKKRDYSDVVQVRDLDEEEMIIKDEEVSMYQFVDDETIIKSNEIILNDFEEPSEDDI